MSVGKLIVIGIALVFVSGGMGAALADWNDAPQSPGPTMDLVDVDARKDDGSDEILEDADEDDDPGGGSGAAGAQNSPVQGAAAGDGDATAGDDATAGGDNTEAALAPPLPPLVAGGAGGGIAAEPAPVAGAAAAGGDSDSGGDSG